jgi:dolichyl-phosphate beta-glucosyltransferase
VNPAFSLILPAYNETLRLPSYLVRVGTYLTETFGDAYEVLVVDDGSTDGTWEFLQQAANEWPELRPLRHQRNRGKGAAIRTGMQAARGRYRLFADADGATPIGDESRLRAALDSGAEVAVGSRRMPAVDVVRDRRWTRKWIGFGFRSLVRCYVSVPVRDTQCGFKMFHCDAAQALFSRADQDGYLLDVELLIWCKQLGYSVAEVPVNWSEIPGSKLNLRRDWRQLLKGLRRLRQLDSELRRRPPGPSR